MKSTGAVNSSVLIPERVLSDLQSCTGLAGTQGRAAESLLQILRGMGAEFYFVEPTATLATPEVEIQPNGRLSLVGFAHPELRQGALASAVNSPWLAGRGDCDIRFLPASRAVMLFQSPFVADPDATDALLSAHRRFLLRLLPLLKPKFAWLDAAGDNAPGSRFVQRVELKHTFWTMFFGPPFVDKFGREFLLSAPAWRVDDLGGDGVLLTASERYTEWLERPNARLLEYLARKAPGLRAYRYTPIP